LAVEKCDMRAERHCYPPDCRRGAHGPRTHQSHCSRARRSISKVWTWRHCHTLGHLPADSRLGFVLSCAPPRHSRMSLLQLEVTDCGLATHRFQSHASRSVAVRNLHGCHGHPPTQEVLPRILHYPDDGKVRTLVSRSPIFAVVCFVAHFLFFSHGHHREIMALAESPRAYATLASSLAPEIFGHDVRISQLLLALILAPDRNLARWFYRTSRRPCCC
jgi:hypothetical protein